MELAVKEIIYRVAVVAPKGRIDAFNVSELSDRCNHLLAEGATNFVIDLSEVTFLDSAGIAVLVSLLKSARQKGGDVKLVWPLLEGAQRILRLTRFDRVFDMFDTVEAALV